MKDKAPKDFELIKRAIEKISYNFLTKLSRNRKEIFTSILLLFLVPICIFLFGQLLCYGKLIFETGRMVFNFLLIFFVIGIFYSLTGKLKPSLYLSSLIIFILGLVNYFITTFRGTPFVPWDIFSFNTAMTVVSTFKVTFTGELVGAITLFILSLIIITFGKPYNIKTKKTNKIIRITTIVSILIFFICFYSTDLINIFGLDHNWDPKEEYHNNGLLASIFKQSKNLIIKLPDGYSLEELQNIINENNLDINNSISNITNENKTNNEDANENINQEEKQTPHIIAIMNESFADLKIINDFNTSEDYMPYIRSLDKNTIKGNVHVSIFGATTPNTEWEFLTANSMAFVPYRTVPYQQYITRKSYSLATLLKEHGYSTYAMHSYYPQGYNRNIVYPLIGFDEFLHLNNMENVTYIREYPDDKSTYDNLISIFENKKEDEKIFNFTLTMQNHGSYTDESYAPTITAENNEYPKLNQYLSLIKETDNSFKYLLEYFENYNEPVVILMFGDHQPYVEDEFYEKLLSTYEDPESKEAKEMKYITPYIIWANYDFDYESYNIPDVSINYLSSILLDVAGIEKNLYLKFLDNLQEYIPIITGNGYVDIENHYHDFTDETKYSNLIKQYNYLQYNNMFDKNHKLVEMFSVSKELN